MLNRIHYRGYNEKAMLEICVKQHILSVIKNTA